MPAGPDADDEHVHLVGKLVRAVDAGARRGLHARLARDVPVVMELHAMPSSDGGVEVLRHEQASCSIFEHNVLLLNRSYTTASRPAQGVDDEEDPWPRQHARTRVADAEPRHPDPRGARRRTRAAHDRRARRAARRAPLGRVPAAAHARGPRPRRARCRRARRARRAHGRPRRRRRARPAGRGAPRAHRRRERARHDVLPLGARSRRVRHARERRAPARGRLGRAAAGDAASGHRRRAGQGDPRRCCPSGVARDSRRRCAAEVRMPRPSAAGRRATTR